jgi:hypothetical protein
MFGWETTMQIQTIPFKASQMMVEQETKEIAMLQLLITYPVMLL